MAGIIEILPGDTRIVEVTMTKYVILEEEGERTVEVGYVNTEPGPLVRSAWIGLLRSPRRSFQMAK